MPQWAADNAEKADPRGFFTELIRDNPLFPRDPRPIFLSAYWFVLLSLDCWSFFLPKGSPMYCCAAACALS